MMNYYLRNEESVLLRALEARRGLRVVIAEGPPGTGKTAFSEYLARRWQGQYFYYLCHHWTSDEELFLRVHVGRVAVGVQDPQDAYEPGVLLRVAQASAQGLVVLCIDEIDKAPPRVEALLLDYLQNGRVVLPDSQVVQAKVDNLVVVLTTNGVRPLSEALLRRGFRLSMSFLPPQVEADLLRKATGAPMGAVRCVVRMLTAIRTRGATKPSLQEARQLLEDLKVAQSAADVEVLIRGWLCKEPEDWEALQSATGGNAASILWGEWRR